MESGDPVNMVRVLIADDNANIREALRLTLEDEGHEVTEAADGVEALEIAADISPDLIFLDIAMPRMDGIEALRRLKAFSATQNIPVVMVTAQNDRKAIAEAVKLGLRDYITKPWSLDAVFDAVALATPKDPPLAQTG